jgi:hypothetical protein
LSFSIFARGMNLTLRTVMSPQHAHRLVPVLFVGSGGPELERSLWEHGIGVITTERVDRALQLLTNFKVAAVIYDDPAVDRIADLTATGTRIIVLVDDETEWNRSDVTTVLRSAPAASIAAAVQQSAAVRQAVGRGLQQLEARASIEGGRPSAVE